MKHNLGLSHYKQLLAYAELHDSDKSIFATAADRRRHFQIKASLREIVEKLEVKASKPFQEQRPT